jgi:hypothetical protein
MLIVFYYIVVFPQIHLKFILTVSEDYGINTYMFNFLLKSNFLNKPFVLLRGSGEHHWGNASRRIPIWRTSILRNGMFTLQEAGNLIQTKQHAPRPPPAAVY